MFIPRRIVRMMECFSSFFHLCFLLVLVVTKIQGCSGCLEEERTALLELKAAFNHPNGSSLPTWNAEKADCCSWKRVHCNNTTRRVIRLSLQGATKFGTLWVADAFWGEWNLNASLFVPFQELTSLDLSVNQLRGWVGKEGFKELAKLNKLRVLDLSSNYFSSLEFLGSVLSLKALYLKENLLNRSSDFEELSNLTKLEVLDLGSNEFIDSIPPFLWDMGSLKVLSLSHCQLSGSLPAQGICKLQNLQELDLSYNQLEGQLPGCRGNVTSLHLLDLSFNEFQGSIPSSLFASLTSLRYLDLSDNPFEGQISLSSFSNNSKLEVLVLGDKAHSQLEFFSFGDRLGINNNQLEVETEYPQWVPKFQLKILSLRNCNLNKPNGVLPSFLSSQYDLRMVDLSHNKLKGKVPTWLLENNARLEVLSLRNNSFVGPLHLPSHSNLSDFDISNNPIGGEIPLNIGEVLLNLTDLNMSTNALQGRIPKSIGDMRQLDTLDFSNNNLSGGIPEHLFMGCWELSFLKLSNNTLDGPILLKESNLTYLKALLLDNNHFNGDISHPLANVSGMSSFITLDISNNFLSGNLPDWLGNIPNLEILKMSRNHFQGPMPMGFCNLTELLFLDLSQNNLTGVMPSCFNLSSLKYLHLQKNGFTGPMPSVPIRSSSLETLDLTDNKFSGNIPHWISVLENLRILLLKGNLLHGSIPSQMCQLLKLRLLDLSDNNLSGSVPSCINKIPFRNSEIPDATAFSQVSGFQSDHNLQTYSYAGRLSSYYFFSFGINGLTYQQEEVEFITKSRADSYKGNILNYMSGVDLSNNKLTGHIPREIGDLNGLYSLNLSHNLLTGSIPETFSNLKQIESLDLSYNRLSGIIPPQLTELTFLEIFTVAQNNLSGPIPDKYQFASSNETSYEGNPFLCGPPLTKSCTTTKPSVSLPLPSDTGEDDNGFITSFYVSFGVAYAVALLGTITLIYINSQWFEILFSTMDVRITLSFRRLKAFWFS